MGSNPSTESNYKSAISSKNRMQMLCMRCWTTTKDSNRKGSQSTAQLNLQQMVATGPNRQQTRQPSYQQLSSYSSHAYAAFISSNPYLISHKKRNKSQPAQIFQIHKARFQGSKTNLTANNSNAHGWNLTTKTSLQPYPKQLTESLKQGLEQDLKARSKATCTTKLTHKNSHFVLSCPNRQQTRQPSYQQLSSYSIHAYAAFISSNPYLISHKKRNKSQPAQICQIHKAIFQGSKTNLTANNSNAHGWNLTTKTSLQPYPKQLTGSLKQGLEQDFKARSKATCTTKLTHKNSHFVLLFQPTIASKIGTRKSSSRGVQLYLKREKWWPESTGNGQRRRNLDTNQRWNLGPKHAESWSLSLGKTTVKAAYVTKADIQRNGRKCTRHQIWSHAEIWSPKRYTQNRLHADRSHPQALNQNDAVLKPDLTQNRSHAMLYQISQAATLTSSSLRKHGNADEFLLVRPEHSADSDVDRDRTSSYHDAGLKDERVTLVYLKAGGARVTPVPHLPAGTVSRYGRSG
ncbi:G-type lectin S-receptor-like serine/threonine-protein kinase [Dorcoceras hygrometricum]|uniref:G-type lectin S-receptor-like serine/threonine-protein kinase n=1 Tax=Dorcoceras hygrometricum TaxID=472368 RepID=A0A2Z7AG59_9LAMI|nr:G-type lectin S-receptor-like serine/threonine-protein kinase [Dorcoceras hygrometricum]